VRGGRAVAGHLAAGRPLIALIEDRPGQFHYVVIVGWHRGRVVAHDPARAPFRVHDEDGFVRAWSASGFWTLLALPGAPAPGAGDPVADRPADPVAASPCAAMVSEGVRLSGTGALERARQLLELAADACPGESPPRRELAGLHALRGEWRLAATRAREALERDDHRRAAGAARAVTSVEHARARAAGNINPQLVAAALIRELSTELRG
jgi:hypothetical protein